ncbi:3-hydroxyacyl-CoA dehydrogenase NAD-binding domain-containing protein [Mobilicoccus pelagius]|uniref:Putative fatty acid oxidation complex subunit alpha n=1 Tax=Mobilicoccus pelagius NBRC 104925 TaxID=1089455 RepID=H5UUK7_9MICO|nr:3-hydroxyacyl-CoA dehydrogenase NAD-binding domain-containing protein [Mobilicoccus pelagius]GAB49415.1 putative fatty acid oxidation complex subunit alpha [Mobilicoccus pelagius NBRC 104925]
MSIDFAAIFPDEVVANSIVRDVELPDEAGTLALITLDNGLDHTKPTTLGPQTVARLGETLDALKTRAEAGEIVGVGITGKPFIFAAGADLSGIGAVTELEQARAIAELGHRVFAKFGELGVPSFAFVNGIALGGGLEIALNCDYRTVSGDVGMIAFPEVFLGILPGWGGTWLTPNLVGPEKAVTLVVENPLSQNRMINGKKAHQLGLFDELFEPADFLMRSLRWAADVIADRTVVERPQIDRDEKTWEAAIAKGRAVADARTGGYSPAPYRALDCLSAARTNDKKAGFQAEEEGLSELLMGEEARAGLYAFDLVQRRAKRPAGAPDKALARKVTKVGIVGAGLMASQLALLFVRRLKVPVVMTDLDQGRVDKGVAYVHAELDKLVAKGRLNTDKANRYKALITGSTSKEGFSDAQFVIEAVFEEMSVKKQVWSEVEAVVNEECILATNTSSLSITEMASELKHPERVVGFHFFNPVAVMPLLEIISGEKTDDAALATAFATGKKLGKSMILVKDSPSFVVNRLLGRFMSDMARIVDAGTPIDVADAGFAGVAPMPPFQLMGLVGPAIALHNNETLAKAFPERFYVSENLRKVVEAKKAAFYVEKDGAQVVDPEIAAIYDAGEKTEVLTAEQVREKVLSGLAEEARLMLEEGVVAAPMDLDLGMITGAGFQFWNGGLTPLLDRSGIAEKVTGARFLPSGAANVPA